MVSINGVPIEEAETSELERVAGELGEMLDNDEGNSADAVAYVEIEAELAMRRKQNGTD